MDFEVKIRFWGSVGTPLHSDIMWGHMAWVIRYLDGEEELMAFIASHEESPTLVSDVFPEGMLPMPVLAPLNPEEKRSFLGNHFALEGPKRIEGEDFLKQLKKRKVIPEEWLAGEEALSARMMAEKALAEVTGDEQQEGKTKEKEKVGLVAHNQINRLKMASQRLYFTQETFFDKNEIHRFFVSTDYLKKDRLREIIKTIGLLGYGRDSSTGKGAFEVVEINEVDLPKMENANAIMSLSHFVPSAKMGKRGWYGLRTKFGKLGGIWAKEKPTPFKKPVVMMTPGSVFMGVNENEFYGELLKDIHYTEKSVVEHAYLFPIRIKVRENGEES